MAESEELKSLLMKVKEESEKNRLKAQYSKSEDHGIWQIDGETVKTVYNAVYGKQVRAEVRELQQIAFNEVLKEVIK